MKTKVLILVIAFIAISYLNYGQSTTASNTLSGTLPTSPAQYIGSSNYADVIFKSNGIERMRILSTGNVGIGNSTINSKLHIGNGSNGLNIQLRDYGFLGITGSAQQVIIGYNVKSTAAGDNTPIVANTSSTGYTAIKLNGGNGGMTFYTNSGNVNAGDFVSGSLAKMIIDGSGNVGIGTTTPAQKLEVNGAIKIGTTTTASPGTIKWDGTNFMGYNGTSWLNFGSSVWTINGNNIYNSNTGNVGIGTTNPGTYKLAVVGSIHAYEVVVETSWSDFVFEQNYKLRTLAEVEKYINEHKHLPDVPSASDVEKNGVNLGKTDAILLQKIEELTLYMIELKKENENLRQRIASIENK
ncbi:MAG: hypothetical protein PHD97_00840 [Bacteroidales bacterium]|nr:hypothetical protein [Bacteroidales bacterium]